MRKILDLLHRWTGGLIGVLLAVLGLSGALLVHKSSWILLPHANDPQVQDVASLASAVARLTTEADVRPSSILFASSDFGLHRLRFDGDAGAYTDQAGNRVTRWSSVWERPELWLFDFHHYLFAGDVGATVAGIAALIGLGFVITGVILWWPLRKTFHFRAWPARMSRPAIVRQHRDLGVVLAPLLFLSLLTGAMMTLRPVTHLVLSPWVSSKELEAATARPAVKGGPLASDPDWAAMLTAARERFPTAELRLIALPRKEGELISLRMKQPEEWLPNGRTLLWFAPEDGRLIDVRDALAQPTGVRINQAVYPVHAAKVGGLAYKLVMTVSGLALAMLGSFSVWAFWFKRPKPAPSRASAPVQAGSLAK